MTALPTVDLPGLEGPLPRLVLGTMTFGDTVDLDTARRMVDQAVASGITHFDTANGYAGGRSEELLGELMVGRRGEVTVATKAGMYPGDSGGEPLLSPAGLRSSLEASLRRLRTDYIDIYYLHQPDRSVPIEVTVEALGAFVKEGTVRAIGVSNFAAWQVADVFAACDAAGTPRPVLAQQLYNLLARRLEAEYAEFALTKGLATIVYNPLGGGLLTGRHSFTESPTDGRFGASALSSMYRDRYWNAETFAVIDSLGRLADEAGIPLPELSLRWLLSKPVVSAVLLGGSKPQQLESNVAAAGRGPLPPDLAAACDEVGLPLMGSMPGYNR